MQLQLQAAGDTAILAEGQQGQAAAAQQQQLVAVDELTSPQQPHPQLQQQLFAVDEQQGALAPAEAESPSAAAAAAANAAAVEAAELRDALASTEEHVAVFVQENERLMDLSNGLRAENEGLKRALSIQVGNQRG